MEPFISQISMFGFNFAPKHWAFCSGDKVNISDNNALYALLGITYGGNGHSTFGLPELRGRTPLHRGHGYNRGEPGGQEYVQLAPDQLPRHTHEMKVIPEDGTQIEPFNNLLAAGNTIYNVNAVSNLTSLDSRTLSATGGGQAHNNMQPYQVVNFCIALAGIFPSRN